MADVENQQDSSFPVKRKPDLYCQDHDNVANKAQKLNPSSNSTDAESNDGELNRSGLNGAEASISPDKTYHSEPEKDENGVDIDLGAEEEQEEGGTVEELEDEDEEEEEEEDELEEEEEEDELEEEDDSSIEIDRKGKGISREDKGKGKLIEEDESDDSDDEDVDEDDESDLSDDPLAEVDLDNILPSRTRRRSIQPGVYISTQISDRGCNDGNDDSSDDSDA